MKRLLLALWVVCLYAEKADAQRNCVTHGYLQQEEARDASLTARLDRFEQFFRQLHTDRLFSPVVNGTGTEVQLIRIPVVVHVLYNTPGQNISNAQIRSQIDVLNRDFRKLNADTGFVPAAFKHLAADCRIEFRLATTDPSGRATSGILRRSTGIRFFGMDDRIKSTAQGGDDAWDAGSYLNIWVGPLAGYMIGYCSPLGISKDKDGVAITYTAFGTMGTAAAPFNKGRTATHEIGHWLGLRHIWGDDYCGNDEVDDTPPQRNSTSGCPSGIITTCNNAPYGNMYMNFMDFTDDACMNLFTRGQSERMRNTFAPGGPRNSILSSNGLSDNPLPAPGDLPQNDAGAIGILTYPNPARDIVSLLSDGNLEGKTIIIYNHLGMPVMKTILSKGTPQLSVRHLQSGMYFLRIDNVTHKLVICH